MTAAWETTPDPWLDMRVARAARIQDAENDLMPPVVDAMTAYLATARALVLGDPEPLTAAANLPAAATPPDLNATPDPAVWTGLVDTFVVPVVDALFGEAFAVTIRDAVIAPAQYVTEYLAAVVDRLTALWPAGVYEEMRYELLEGMAQGESIEELRDRIAYITGIDALSRTFRAKINDIDRELANPDTTPERATQLRSERAAAYRDLDEADYVWHYQARRVARTETIGALNGGAYFGAYAWTQETGEQQWKQWLATNDTRTRTSHRHADGQVVALDEAFSVGGADLLWPGDPTGPATEVIQCRCTLLYLDADEAMAQAAAYAELDTARRALTAAATVHGEDPMPDALADPGDVEPIAPEPGETPVYDADGVLIPRRYEGPIMSLDRLTEDGRVYYSDPDGNVAHAPLPLTLNWQREYKPEHLDAVGVGVIEDVWQAPYTTDTGEQIMSVWGRLAFDLASPDGYEIARRLRDGYGGWISADLRDLDGYWETRPNDRGVDIEAAVIDYWKLDGATLLNGGQAMEWARLRPKDAIATATPAPEPDVILASASGSTQLPLAPRDHAWDSAAADKRVAEWATDDDGELDGDRYGQAHFYVDDSIDDDLLGAYKLPFADIIDGTLTAVPDAVFAAAAALQGARGGVDIPETDMDAVRDRVAEYYARMSKEFDTDYTPPWDDKTAADSDAQAVPSLLAGAADLAEPFVADPAVLMHPPASWFTLDPAVFDGLEPSCFVTVTDDGRVFGYVGARDTPHLAYYPSSDVRIPYSNTGYALFAGGPVVRTREGTDVPVGAITMGCSHAAPDASISLRQAMAWYDHEGNAIANVRCEDTPLGVAVMGALVPGATRHQVHTLRSRYISGDWRQTPHGLELAGILAVTSGGFQRVRRTDSAAPPYVLIASMGAPRPDPDAKTAAAIRESLQAVADADAQFRAAAASAILERFR